MADISYPLTLVVEAGDAGLFHVTSPDYAELFVSGRSTQECLAAVVPTLEAIAAAHDKREG